MSRVTDFVLTVSLIVSTLLKEKNESKKVEPPLIHLPVAWIHNRE